MQSPGQWTSDNKRGIPPVMRKDSARSIERQAALVGERVARRIANTHMLSFKETDISATISCSCGWDYKVIGDIQPSSRRHLATLAQNHKDHPCKSSTPATTTC